jgi:hypothetical protein
MAVSKVSISLSIDVEAVIDAPTGEGSLSSVVCLFADVVL